MLPNESVVVHQLHKALSIIMDCLNYLLGDKILFATLVANHTEFIQN